MDKKQLTNELKKIQIKLGSDFNRNNIRKENSKVDYWIVKHFSTYTRAYKAAGINQNLISSQEHNNKHEEKTLIIPPKRIIRDYEWLGRAAEYYVVAELLYQGYNATRLTMDTGIDIFAIKDDKTFYIQVKSTSYNTIKKEIKISVDSFTKNNGGSYYYILVITDTADQTRDILVLPSYQIEVIMKKNIHQIESKEIKFKITKENNFIKLNNTDVTFFKNNWGMIK